MEIRTNAGDDFAALGRKFRAAGANGAAIRKKLTATIQARLKRITDEQKAALTGMRVKSVGGRGSKRRAQFSQAQADRKLAMTGKKTRAAKGGHGLRATIARGIKSKVAYTGFKLGARITIETNHMPPSQRTLPKHLDNPRGWRHPVWGNRSKWVRQIGEPWFSGPIRKHRVAIQREVQQDVDEVMRTLK
jgi:hypothetical protein